MGTMNCENCATAIPAGSGEYTSAGKLLCPSCMGNERIAEADMRGAAARRQMRMTVVATIATLVLVPSVMFALGLGKIVGYTLMGLGCVSAFGGVMARRMFVQGNQNPDPTVARGTVYLILVGFAVTFLGVFLSGAGK